LDWSHWDQSKGAAVFRGFSQLGDRVVITVLATDADGAVSLPAAAPWVSLYHDSDSGAPRFSTQLPPVDPVKSPGLFARALHLDQRFPTGYYSALAFWLDGSGNARVQRDSFVILPGGHGDGAVIGMYFYTRPHANFLVQHLDSGKLVRGRNPAV
jgi:hypothetical protein